MQRTIYHGSSKIIRTPRFGAGTAANDYGLGFYCTENPVLASEWAVARTADGFVNRYTIETDGLRIINLNSPEYCILHWLSVLLNYREFDSATSASYQAREYVRSVFSVDFQSCDCIIGFRADNCNFTYAQSFLNGNISFRELNDAIRLADTGRQFVLKSNRAFDRMLFYGYTAASADEHYASAAARDRKSMQHFASLTAAGQGHKSAGSRGSDLYVSRIVEENIRPYDPVLVV